MLLRFSSACSQINRSAINRPDFRYCPSQPNFSAPAATTSDASVTSLAEEVRLHSYPVVGLDGVYGSRP